MAHKFLMGARRQNGLALSIKRRTMALTASPAVVRACHTRSAKEVALKSIEHQVAFAIVLRIDKRNRQPARRHDSDEHQWFMAAFGHPIVPNDRLRKR